MTGLEVYEAFHQRLGTTGVDSAAELLAPDCVFDEPRSLPWGGEWVGCDGFIALFTTIREICDVTLRSAVHHDAGDVVVDRMEVVFVSRATGAELDTLVSEMWTIQDGLIRRVDIFLKDTAALLEMLGS